MPRLLLACAPLIVALAAGCGGVSSTVTQTVVQTETVTERVGGAPYGICLSTAARIALELEEQRRSPSPGRDGSRTEMAGSLSLRDMLYMCASFDDIRRAFQEAGLAEPYASKADWCLQADREDLASLCDAVDPVTRGRTTPG